MDTSNLKDIPFDVLIELLSNAYKRNEQGLINVYIYELASRFYDIDSKMSFTEMLKQFGYKRLDGNNVKTK